jgi:hypothetical protein
MHLYSPFRCFIPRLFLVVAMVTMNHLVIGQATQELKGEVIGESAKPLPSASVSLEDTVTRESLKTVTDSNGRFFIPHNIKGTRVLIITYTGYTAYRSAPFEPGTRDLGQIRLSIPGSALAEVVMASKQKLIEVTGGNIEYNVAASITAQGTDALEVLKKAPGVNVENENTIVLNGKQGPLILIDGRQTYLSGKELVDLLRSMPASGIRSIEIINNPTAKYDAAGSAGIINIKTVKIRQKGFSAAISSGIAVGVTLKQNQDISFNYRNNKINLYGSYNHFIGYYNYLYGSNRTQNNKQYNSATDDIDKRTRAGTRLGLDYMLDKKNTIGILLSGNFVFGGGITRTETLIGPTGLATIEEILRAENDYYHQRTERYNINLNYRYENEKGTIINADADYGSFTKGNGNLQSNSYTDGQGMPLYNNLYHSLNGIDINLKALKLDLTKNIGQGTLEAGVKYSSIHSGNSARFYYQLPSGDSLDDRRTNTFRFNENITSAYASYKKIFGKWTMQGGLRIENTQSKGSLFFKTGNTDSTQIIRRGYTDLFPSVGISFTPSDKYSISLNYSKRLDRPAYQDLNPFIYLLDELSFWQGNPFLRPQYTHKVAVQYVYKSSTILTLSYLHTAGYSARITDTLQSARVVMVPRNLGVQKVVSLSATQTLSPFKWWSINLNGIISQVKNQIAFDQYRRMNLTQWAGRVGLQQTFKLPNSFAVEVSGYFNSKKLTGANEFTKAMGQVDMGLQKSILAKKATLRVSVTDIFKGSRFNSIQQFDGFYSANYGYYETRQLRFNFTWKFSDAGAKSPRSRNSALESENGRIK